jgi:hypothetical protein
MQKPSIARRITATAAFLSAFSFAYPAFCINNYTITNLGNLGGSSFAYADKADVTLAAEIPHSERTE